MIDIDDAIIAARCCGTLESQATAYERIIARVTAERNGKMEEVVFADAHIAHYMESVAALRADKKRLTAERDEARAALAADDIILHGNCLDPIDKDAPLPYWLLDESHVCRAVDCLPECPSYDHGCRIRANSIAGDALRADLAEARSYQAAAAESLAHELEIAWPGDGHWTREPAEVAGWYPIGKAKGHFFCVHLSVGGFHIGWHRWSIPFPVDALPSVSEEE